MKAIEIDGNIKTYTNIPQTWTDANGLHLNFRKAKHSDYGLYDVVTPAYDSQSQTLGSLTFDKKKKVFTYSVIDINFDATYEVVGDDLKPTGETKPVYDINVLKADKILDIKLQAGSLLKPTDWYVIRKAERAIDIPVAIAAERLEVITKSNTFEEEINALQTYLDVKKYSYSFSTEIE
jgi:hypothetical protein